MSLFKPRTVRNSLWPSLAIIWTFGSFSSKLNRARRILYALMMTGITVYVNMYALNFKFLSTQSKFSWVMAITNYLKVPVGLVIIWLWELKISDVVENAIEELTKLDEELKHFGVSLNHKKFMWKQLITIGGFMILLSTVATLYHSSLINLYDSPNVHDSLTVYLLLTIAIQMQYFQTLMVNLVFAMMLEAFRIRFKLVHEVFNRIAESEDWTKVKVFTTSYSRIPDISSEKSQECHGRRHLSSHLVMERVDRACRIHQRLFKIAQDVGDAFSFYFCITYPDFLFGVMLKAFLLVSFVSGEQDDGASASMNIISTIYMVGRFWHIVVLCSNTMDEANKLGASLYLVPIGDAAVHNQLQEYSVHIIQRKLRFTIGGIRDMDRNLAKDIFCTVVKYVVVLLQFRKNF